MIKLVIAQRGDNLYASQEALRELLEVNTIKGGVYRAWVEPVTAAEVDARIDRAPREVKVER